MANSKTEAQIEEKFMNELKHHLSGWHTKISEDFGEENFNNELSLLQSDPVYSKFGFAIPEYVLVRLMGRFSISIGRRLGEIYDKVPMESLSDEDNGYVSSVFNGYFPESEIGNGIGIEIRYNFNPNDSSRLRKDEKMASLLRDAGLFPIYLIFSEISPRDEAIARLKRAGWSFVVGKAAEEFMYNLVGMDFSKILDRPKIQNEIRKEIDTLMSEMRNSKAFKQGAKLE